ncbi:exopolygalacturonase-like [Rhodamnia argentea]|uniref:Exopolygalacturonase-like n=1 Tax=Rhodamnia argentea TaxID=178133 RepID=A0A8B8Q7Y6_9MYRT|nr:exopolygalacturonase-like [Rhodamnia argentea]
MATSGGIITGKAMTLGLALLACLVAGGESRGPIYGALRATRRGLVDTGATVFDVTTYGAKADGQTDNALAFVKAWNAACNNSGPAKLVFPTGTFVSGPVVFQGPCQGLSPITIEVKGTIKASTDITEYSDDGWFWFELIDGLVLKGGIFDGQGPAAWQYNDCKRNSACQHLPVSLKFNKVKNILVDGVTSLNSKGFHFSLTFSQNFTGVNLNISAPGNSPNTDGIHLSSSDHINISHSAIATGDDCIGIIQGATNVSITDITCGPGHGISIGSLGKYPGEKDVIGVRVWNATLTNTTNGLRIKSFPGNKQLHATDIIFEDVVLNNVKNPIIIDQNYGFHKATLPSSVRVSDVHFKNIRGTSVSDVAVLLECSSLNPCDLVELSNINLSYAGPPLRNKNMTSLCTNAKPIFIGTQNPPACL